MFAATTFEETIRAAFAAAAVCLAVFVLVMLKRAARIDLPDRTVDLLLAAAVTLTILRALTTPNLNGWASERLRSLHFDISLWRSYALPFAGEASWVAAGIAILRAARTERRGWWLAAGGAMAAAGGLNLLGTLQVLNHIASASLLAWIQLAAFIAMAALLTSVAVRRSRRDIIIPVASRDTA